MLVIEILYLESLENVLHFRFSVPIDRSYRNLRQQFPVALGFIEMLNELGASAAYSLDEDGIGFSDAVPDDLSTFVGS